MTSAVRYWLMLACLLSAAYGSFLLYRLSERSALHPVEIAQVKGPPLDRFELVDQAGRPFDSDSLQGQVWVGSFFFTNCPGACLHMNRALAAIQETRPNSVAKFVSITCDPDNDTPQALTEYAANLHADPARWTFLTGDIRLIKRIGNDFFQTVVEPGTHSDRAFVVDRQGQVRGRFRLTEPDQLEMLRNLLAVVEAEPAAENKPAADVTSDAEQSGQ